MALLSPICRLSVDVFARGIHPIFILLLKIGPNAEKIERGQKVELSFVVGKKVLHSNHECDVEVFLAETFLQKAVKKVDAPKQAKTNKRSDGNIDARELLHEEIYNLRQKVREMSFLIKPVDVPSLSSF